MHPLPLISMYMLLRSVVLRRGSSVNKKPVESVVVASLGEETHFGAFLPDDVKEHLAGLIRDYYGEPSSAGGAEPFLSDDVPGR